MTVVGKTFTFGFLSFWFYVLICALVLALIIVLFNRRFVKYRFLLASAICMLMGYMLFKQYDNLLIYSLGFLTLSVINAVSNFALQK